MDHSAVVMLRKDELHHDTVELVVWPADPEWATGRMTPSCSPAPASWERLSTQAIAIKQPSVLTNAAKVLMLSAVTASLASRTANREWHVLIMV